MSLKIKTTGLEQYAPGGTARLKMLVIGGPGAGKTRQSSFWPKPFYLSCEGGLASVADRKVPYVDINNSHDMLEALEYLKNESNKPEQFRTVGTVVVDTLDAFQRKVKNEWMEKENKQTFTGWDAWGYLNSKMQMLMTRLLNLDLNIIVNVHYKDKTIKDDDTGRESRELMLQLSGEMADQAFNDFDLVGWIGTYWESEEGQRVEKRGLTFKRTPDKPFLKDRLFITPPWMEIVFAESDYTNLFARLTERLEGLEAGEEIGEVPSYSEFSSTPSAGVVSPSAAGGGALPPVDPKEIPLEQHDKPTLAKMARELGLKLPGNALKSEIVAAIKAEQAKRKAELADTPVRDESAEIDSGAASVEVPVQAEAPAVEQVSTPVESAPVETVTTEVGEVDPKTGEVVAPAPESTADDAVRAVEEALGGTVISEEVVAEAPQVAQTPAKAAQAPAEETKVCSECGKDLANEKVRDWVTLSFIKFRAHLCNEHYQQRKSAQGK